MIDRDDDDDEILGDLDGDDDDDRARPGGPAASTDAEPLDYGAGPHDEILGLDDNDDGPDIATRDSKWAGPMYDE